MLGRLKKSNFQFSIFNSSVDGRRSTAYRPSVGTKKSPAVGCRAFGCVSLVLNYLSLALMAAEASSYPGLSKRANIFFLYASTPGWLKGFTPKI